MNNDLFIAITKKRHRHIRPVHHEYDEYPTIFSGIGINKKNFYKVGHDLKIKEAKVEVKNKNNKDDKILLAKSLNIGYYLITPLLIGVFLGYWFDKIFNTKPMFLLGFFSLGIAGVFYNLWKITQENK